MIMKANDNDKTKTDIRKDHSERQSSDTDRITETLRIIGQPPANPPVVGQGQIWTGQQWINVCPGLESVSLVWFFNALQELEKRRSELQEANNRLLERARRAERTCDIKIYEYPYPLGNGRLEYRCDLIGDDGKDHHGIGSTKGEALHQATFAWERWERSKK